MSNIKKILWSVLAAAPAMVAAQPGVMSSEAEGYFERGLLMYENHNYVGAIDQLGQVSKLPSTPSMRPQLAALVALVVHVLSIFKRATGSQYLDMRGITSRPWRWWLSRR